MFYATWDRIEYNYIHFNIYIYFDIYWILYIIQSNGELLQQSYGAQLSEREAFGIIGDSLIPTLEPERIIIPRGSGEALIIPGGVRG